jgi:YNFM family putative membrane transporter
MAEPSYYRLQLIVFALVSASFTNIYITQPVLPVLQSEFEADMVLVSFSVSAVIFGIALSNLPFGYLADRVPIQPIILTGGIAVAAGGLICAITNNLWILIAGRFLQGVFIPALTTCLAAYLAKSLPAARLNVVMGSYVAATVLGGLGGRLLGGWIHPPLHWRYAFISAAALILTTTIIAVFGLPRPPSNAGQQRTSIGIAALLKSREILQIFFCGAGSFAIFSSVFNYLPFRLTAPPFNFSTELATLLYLTYTVGIFMGPVAGKISDRMGSGNTLIAGSLALGAALILLLLPSILAVILGLLGMCASFFSIHAAAVGALNRMLLGSQGRANALYVLFYYIGGWLGITVFGMIYQQSGWRGVVYLGLTILIIPVSAGISQRNTSKNRTLG